MHRYPVTKIGNMILESNEFTIEIDETADFKLVFVHSV